MNYRNLLRMVALLLALAAMPSLAMACDPGDNCTNCPDSCAYAYCRVDAAIMVDFNCYNRPGCMGPSQSCSGYRAETLQGNICDLQCYKLHAFHITEQLCDIEDIANGQSLCGGFSPPPECGYDCFMVCMYYTGNYEMCYDACCT